MKLTKQIREAILNAALDRAAIPAREAAIKQRYADWAEAVRVRFVTPEVLAAIEDAANILKPFNKDVVKGRPHVNKEVGIQHANVAGMRRDVYWGGETSWPSPDARVNKPAPAYGAVTLTADDPLTEQLYAIDHDAAALAAEREQLTLSLRAVLNSVTTDKRLIEVWPEAVAFIPVAERASSPQLPALPIADLNRMIGLP